MGITGAKGSFKRRISSVEGRDSGDLVGRIPIQP
jgi:hypothetical protein